MYERRLLISVRKHNRLTEELIACNKNIAKLTKLRYIKLKEENLVEHIINMLFTIAIVDVILPQVLMISKFHDRINKSNKGANKNDE